MNFQMSAAPASDVGVAEIVRHIVILYSHPNYHEYLSQIMFINKIIDLLLPMQPRVATAARQRALNTLTRSSEASDSLRARTLVDARSKDFGDNALLNEGIAPLYTEDQAAMITSDIQSEYLRDARAAHVNRSNLGIDAASPNLRPNPKDKTRGNPEGMGMLDQVGSASGTAYFFENGGKQGMGQT